MLIGQHPGRCGFLAEESDLSMRYNPPGAASFTRRLRAVTFCRSKPFLHFSRGYSPVYANVDGRHAAENR